MNSPPPEKSSNHQEGGVGGDNRINGDGGDGRPTGLPTGQLLGAVAGAACAVAGVWLMVVWGLGRSAMDIVAGPAGAGVVAVAAVVGVLAIMPWRPRPVSLWISIWMGQTIVRMMLTPALSYLLYSAASFRGSSFWLAVGFSYLAAVIAEAGVLARFLKSASPLVSSSPAPKFPS